MEQSVAFVIKNKFFRNNKYINNFQIIYIIHKQQYKNLYIINKISFE